MKAKNNILKKYWAITLTSILLLLSLIFVLIKGENLIFAIWDNLDSGIPILKIMRDNAIFFNPYSNIPILNGILRIYFQSPFQIGNILYAFFHPFFSYVVYFYLRIILSIVGWNLLTKEIMSHDYSLNIATLVGLIYGMLPVFPLSGIGFASLPILLWMFLKTINTGNWKYYFSLLLYPLLSSFAMFGIFICGYFFLSLCFYKARRFRIFLALILVSIGYIITEIYLFQSMFCLSDVTIRSEFSEGYGYVFYNFTGIVREFLYNFLIGNLHAGTLQLGYFVVPICLLYILLHDIFFIVTKQVSKLKYDVLNWILLFITFNSLISLIERIKSLKLFINEALPFLAGFTFSRTLWFNGFAWFLVFTIILIQISKKFKFLSYSMAFIGIAIIAIMPNIINEKQSFNDIRKNLINLRSTSDMELTYAEFYSEGLFNKIKQDIDYQGENSVAFGFFPGILTYNNISTLDGYSSFYPLKYKHEFRKIIRPLLDKNSFYKNFFDTWGARAYIFSESMDYAPRRNLEITHTTIDIDINQFKSMGGVYIFSRVSLDNSLELGLKYCKKYESNNSPYTMYVYKSE